jgi:type I restriction enzyme, S subunit
MPFYQGKKDFGEKFVEPPTTWTTETTKIAVGGDVLMSVRAPVGPVNFATEDVCIGRGLAAIRCSPGLSRDFLFYCLLSLQPAIAGREGAVFASISRADIAALPIPVPPLAEQQRIVALLDEAFTGLVTAQANAEKNLQNARELFESHLHTVFVRAGAGWVEKPLASLCQSSRVITYGVIKLGDQTPAGVPCLRTSNVRWLKVDTEGMKRIAPSLSAEYGRTILRGGEVLVNVRGTLGGVAVVSPEMIGWNVSREVAVVPIDVRRNNPSFLCYLIGSGVSQKWLGGVKKGAAYVGINIEDLRLLPVCAPSLEEQARVVHHLDELWEETQHLESVYQKKLVALDDLKKSLLHHAFSGAL